MSPLHRDLGNSQPIDSGQVQQFGVEAPAINALCGENLAGRSTGECLETALRIFVIQPQNKAQQQIVGTAEDLPQNRLSLGLQARIDPAGSNGDIGATLDGRKKFRSFGNGRGQVRITE